MSHSLLILECPQDTTRFYLIPNGEMLAEWRQYLQEAHGHIINVEADNDGMKFVNTALASTPDSVAEVGFEKYLGVLAKYCHDITTPITGKNITDVYHVMMGL